MSPSAWWEQRRQRRAANKRLGEISKGGEQGAFDLGRKEALKPYLNKKKGGGWVIGKVHHTDDSFIGQGDKFLTTDEECHGWIIGPTRTGKGASQLVFNVLNHPGNQVIYDPKAELYCITAQILAAQGKKVFLFVPLKKAARRLGVGVAPFDTDFNPMLDFMGPLDKFDPELPKRINEFVTTLVELGKGGDESMKFWNLTTTAVIKALLAYGLIREDQEAVDAYDEAEADGTLTTEHAWELTKYKNLLFAAEFPVMPYDEQIAVLEEMAGLKDALKKEAEDANREPFYPSTIDLITKGGVSGLQVMQSENSDIRGTLTGMIDAGFGWIDGPAIKEHLRGNDYQFGMSMLKSEDDVVVFVVIPDTAFETHGAYLRMVFTSMLNACTDNDWAEGVNPKRYKINAICDEFPLWGRMPALVRLFNLGAGADLRAIIISQNKANVDELYGENNTETFIDNSWQLLIGGGGNKTGKYFSEKAGRTRARNKRTSETSDRMVKVYEVDELWNTAHRARGTILFFENGCPPLMVQKVVYHDEAQSGLVKYKHYTPPPERQNEEDKMLHPSIPRDMLHLAKGNGRSHVQMGAGASRRQLTHH